MSGTEETSVDAPHARRGSSAPRGGAVRVGDNGAQATPRGEALAEGTQVGEYTVGALLGAGACGAVYRATHTIIGKAAAIKVLNARFAHDDHMVTRFVEEARAVNRIGHPDIIDIFGFGELPDGRHYSVMEFLNGETLGQRLQQGPLSLAETLRVLQPVARALDAAHAAGVAHRDVKPENIFLQRSDDTTRTRLLDFGIAKLNVDGDSPTDTGTGATLGTPSYMAPEQCVGKNVDHRADIYAFGVVAFECLSGRRPYEEDSRYLMMAAHIHQPFPLLHTTTAVPDTVDDALRVIAAKDPAARPASVMDAWRLLEAAARAPVAAPSPRRFALAAVGAVVVLAGAALWNTQRTSTHTAASVPVAATTLSLPTPPATPATTTTTPTIATTAPTTVPAATPPSPHPTSPRTTASTPAVPASSSTPSTTASGARRGAKDENKLEEWQ